MILSLKYLKEKSIAYIGGKAFHLGELCNLGLAVPEGFVITVDVFDKFLEQNKLKEKISKLLKKIDYKDIGSVESVSRKIRNLLLKGQIDKKIEKEIKWNFKKLNTKYVAVRSSATLEDTFGASWAGELETYLGIKENQLINSIKKCWASLFSPKALFYKFRKKIKEDVSVAVIIQKMVDAEVSGIAFTINPVTKNKNEIVIEAGLGLGDLIVGGKIIPDCYVVNKSKLKILSKSINEQDRMMKFTKDRIKIVKLTRVKKNLQKLSDIKILELAKLCKIIERHYKFPQDIEWCYSRGKIYILQTRPITA